MSDPVGSIHAEYVFVLQGVHCDRLQARVDRVPIGPLFIHGCVHVHQGVARYVYDSLISEYIDVHRGAALECTRTRL